MVTKDHIKTQKIKQQLDVDPTKYILDTMDNIKNGVTILINAEKEKPVLARHLLRMMRDGLERRIKEIDDMN